MTHGRRSPEPRRSRAVKRRRWSWLVIVLLLLLALGYYLIFVNQYVVAFADDEQHFMHGSIGSEISTAHPTGSSRRCR